MFPRLFYNERLGVKGKLELPDTKTLLHMGCQVDLSHEAVGELPHDRYT